MTPAQAAAHVALYLFTWGGWAVVIAVAIAATRRHRVARRRPEATELGTRLDVRL